jgi:hypothetical protein
MSKVQIRPPALGRLATAAALLMMLGCGEGDEVVAPGSPDLLLLEANALVDGEPINGQTIDAGDNGGFVGFEARLVNGQHNPAPGQQVRVEYDIPAMDMMGMMRRKGSFMLHDDGMHGDVTPNDGIYCYNDVTSNYGCHAPGARPGQHHYDFCGIDREGRESNHVIVEVVLGR